MDFGLLLIILFILAPLLERLLKAGRPPEQPPQQRRPGQRLPQQPRPRPAERPRAGADDDSAAGVLPDDLWEVLTGERRPPRPEPRSPGAELPPPAPAPPRTEPARPLPRAEAPRPRPVPERPDPRPRDRPPVPVGQGAGRGRPAEPVRERRLPPVDLRRERGDVPARRERSQGPPPSAADDLVRPVHDHEAPVVVSLEAPLERSDVRHARFRERLATSATNAYAIRGADAGSHLLESREDLRRAIILSEILGPPRGLQ